jgi:hypothetical protein
MSATDFVYDNARQLFATAQINWTAAPINAMLVSNFYAPQLTHVNVADIDPSAIIVRDLALTNLTAVKGICAGIIPEILGVVTPYTVVAVILYVKGANDGVSPLIYYSSTGPGFPFQVQGFDYSVGFDQVSGGFFQV